jgi:tetratricopeptide (TPR) repeat protein
MSEPTQEQIKSLEERLAHEPQSPLFARLAAYYLSTGRAKDALRLCDNGLANFPFYSTAHLIKGNVLVNLGMTAEAKHEYEVVREFMPTSETAARLWSSIDLGTPSESRPAPVVEESVEVATAVVEPKPMPVVEAYPPAEEIVVPEPSAPAVEVVVHEELAPPKAVAEVVEEHAVQEPLAEEPPPVEQAEATVVAEDAFGLPVEPAVAEEPPQQAETDFGFSVTAEPAQQTAEETPVGEVPAQEVQAPVEDSFGQAAEISPEPPIQETQEQVTEAPTAEAPAAEQADWFDAFSQLQQPTEEAQAAPEPAPAEEENPFAAFGTDQPTPAVEGESYEDFTGRVRMELFGTEDTMSLEEYLGGGSAAAPDQISDLAEKLKASPRITPPVINFSEKSSRASSDVEATSESGLVTPTLAEIYVKQGWYDDAIKAYKTLAGNKPEEKEKYMQRIAEIEGMKKAGT